MRTVGVEEEFLLIDPATATPRPDGSAVTETAARASDGQYERELKNEQVEQGSPPVHSVADLTAALRSGRQELIAAAAARGVRVIGVGASPQVATATVTANERYERMHAEFGEVAAVQLTCGMHVHVSVDDENEGVRAIDALGPWLPPLLALSANSPFWGGRDTGYASYRTVLWGQWPTAGPTGRFGSPERYRELSAQLVESGAALDDGMLYYAARLSNHYPTVEIRVADVCARVADAVVLAALARALVDTAAHDVDPEPVPTELLRAAHWRAARSGVGDVLVDPTARPLRLRPAWEVIDRLVEYVEPALAAAGDKDTVRDGLARIRSAGTGAEVQREAYARRHRIGDVLDGLAELTAE